MAKLSVSSFLVNGQRKIQPPRSHFPLVNSTNLFGHKGRPEAERWNFFPKIRQIQHKGLGFWPCIFHFNVGQYSFHYWHLLLLLHIPSTNTTCYCETKCTV